MVLISYGKNKMKTVNIEREKLLETVKTNLEQHIKQYNEAVEDYKTGIVILFQENLAKAQTGDLERIKTIENKPQTPVSYENQYTRVIRMLEMSSDDYIELSDHEFEHYVLDNWDWKQSFNLVNSSYKTLLA